jgi:hypothetical protein
MATLEGSVGAANQQLEEAVEHATRLEKLPCVG